MIQGIGYSILMSESKDLRKENDGVNFLMADPYEYCHLE